MSSIGRVMMRELRRVLRIPMLWVLLGPTSLVMTFVTAAVFQHEVVRQLPIALLDLDGTPSARVAARQIGAARTVRIASRVHDLGEAEALIKRLQVYAVLIVPRHFERDLRHGRSPQVTLMFNEQYLTAGNLISADIARAVNAGSGAVAMRLQRSRGLTERAADAAAAPIRVDTRLLFNPASNYARGVGLVLIIGVLQVVAGLSAIYAIGSELRDATASEWLQTAGGSTAAAWIGKLAFYIICDLLLTLIIVGGFIAYFQIPVLGNIGLLVLGAAAFALATKAIAVMLTVRLANLGRALAFGALWFGPAVAFSGGTFPRLSMSNFAQVWGGIVPLTGFTRIVRDQVSAGSPVATSLVPIGMLLALAFITMLIALPRMSRVLRDPESWGERE